jgi:hypothetical protein
MPRKPKRNANQAVKRKLTKSLRVAKKRLVRRKKRTQEDV